MRATFTTEYIYDGSEGFKNRQEKMCAILEIKPKSDNMVGQLSGILSGLDLAESDIKRWIEEQSNELSKVTTVEFRIVWLLEGGDIICKKIIPSSKTLKP
jgi:hypothetical protein